MPKPADFTASGAKMGIHRFRRRFPAAGDAHLGDRDRRVAGLDNFDRAGGAMMRAARRCSPPRAPNRALERDRHHHGDDQVARSKLPARQETE